MFSLLVCNCLDAVSFCRAALALFDRGLAQKLGQMPQQLVFEISPSRAHMA